MKEIEKKDWTVFYDKELDGKYFFLMAINSIIDNKNFLEASMYFKKGLDYVTCDCILGGWKDKYDELSEKVFDNEEKISNKDENYLFCKAFLLSYEESKESLNSALESILIYSYLKPDEYANYLTGKILLFLGSPIAALQYLSNYNQTKNKARYLYRIGRIKELTLIDYGLDELYYSFLENYSSICCGREFRRFTKKHNIVLKIKKNLLETNFFARYFLNDFEDSEFHDLFDQIVGENSGQNIKIDEIEEFIQILKRNKSKFIKPPNYIKDITYYTHRNSLDINTIEILNRVSNIKNRIIKFYEDDWNEDDLNDDDFEDNNDNGYVKYGGYKGFSDEVIDDVFDGDPINTWNID